MHQFLKTILVTIPAIVFSYGKSAAQVDKPVQAVIEISGFSIEKTLPMIQGHFQQNGFLKLKSVCVAQGWIYIEADPEAFINGENILQYLQDMIPGVLLKNNAFENDMVQNCNEPVVYLDP